MSVFVDTGVLYADHDRAASRHNAASESLHAVYQGRFGQPIVSDYVYDEAVTLTLRRTERNEASANIGRRIRGADPFPTVYSLRYVDQSIFERAVSIFEGDDDHGLSFTDATTVAIVNADGIDRVLSFDDDFDGVIDRLPPESV